MLLELRDHAGRNPGEKIAHSMRVMNRNRVTSVRPRGLAFRVFQTLEVAEISDLGMVATPSVDLSVIFASLGIWGVWLGRTSIMVEISCEPTQ